jgi:hypothetical protein
VLDAERRERALEQRAIVRVQDAEARLADVGVAVPRRHVRASAS